MTNMSASQSNSASDFQARVLAAQEMQERVRDTNQRLHINADGSVRLFHSTSAANMQAILQQGHFAGNTWFGASKSATIPHAKPKHGDETRTLEIPVEPRDIEFSTGTGEFYAPNGLKRHVDGIWRDAGSQPE